MRVRRCCGSAGRVSAFARGVGVGLGRRDGGVFVSVPIMHVGRANRRESSGSLRPLIEAAA